MALAQRQKGEAPITATTPNAAIAGAAEEAPETGEISAHDVVISSVDHWIEDGLHVFRSREFDVSSEHEDVQTAVDIFVENAEDLCLYLADLITEKKATEHELETAALLFPRFVQVWRESERLLEEAQKRLINVNLRRRRRRLSSSGWRRSSTPSSSSQPLPV